MGFNDGTAWGIDEYGRMPGNLGYKDQAQHDKDWVSFHNARSEAVKTERSVLVK